MCRVQIALFTSFLSSMLRSSAYAKTCRSSRLSLLRDHERETALPRRGSEVVGHRAGARERAQPRPLARESLVRIYLFRDARSESIASNNDAGRTITFIMCRC